MVSICCSPPLRVPPACRSPLAQDGEELEDALGRPGAGAAVAPGLRATSRFSCTVRSEKTRRSSGTKPMPCRAMRNGGSPTRSCRRSVTRPRAGRREPHDAAHGGRLAHAVAAEQAHDLARLDRRATGRTGCGCRRSTVSTWLSSSRAISASAPRYTRCTSPLARTSAGAPSASTAPWWSTVIRWATANTTSMSCSVNSTVRPVSRGDARDQRHDLAALARGHARGRLVEQQQLGRAGQRDGQLQPPLVAVGQDPARLGRLLAQAHALQQRQRLVAVEAPRRHQHVEVPVVVAEEGRLHVLEHGEAAEDAGDLERAAHAAAAEAVRRQAADRPRRRRRCWPVSCAMSPVIRLNSVVLPAPLGPMIARRSPGGTARSTPFTAWTPPKCLRRPRVWRTSALARAGCATVVLPRGPRNPTAGQ